MQLALPSRDYYLKSSSEGDLQAYHKYMTNVAVLLGANKTSAGNELKAVVEFEKKLANVSKKLFEHIFLHLAKYTGESVYFGVLSIILIQY